MGIVSIILIALMAFFIFGGEEARDNDWWC